MFCVLFILSWICLFLAFIPYLSVVTGHAGHDESSAIPHLRMPEIQDIVKRRKEVLVFVHKLDCGQKCDEHIEGLESAVQEVQMMGNSRLVHIVASTDDAFFKFFQTKKNVLLAFYRKGVPILYEDIAEDKLLRPENLVQWVAETRNEFVQTLTDDTFEHDTQAASGATTGDWFVMFYKPGCYDKFLPKMETLNFRLRGGRQVLAQVNLAESKELEKRFELTKCPTFMLFRRGKMYEYELQKYDVDTLQAFVTNGYKNAKSKKVPIERSPFDLITDYAVNFIKRHHGAKEKIAFAAFATIVAVAILVYITKPTPKIEAKKE